MSAACTISGTRLELAITRVAHLAKGLAASAEPWTEERLWYELVACILGSRVPFQQAAWATQYLERLGLLRPPYKADGDHYAWLEERMAEALSAPRLSSVATETRSYRFPRLRANHVRRTAEAIYARGRTLRGILMAHTDHRTTRRELVSIGIGVGPKQASLFLRNVGHSDSLAILDAHVIRFMVWQRLLCPSHRKVGYLRTYEQVEDVLRCYAERLGLPVGCLDTGIWVVMRVVGRADLS